MNKCKKAIVMAAVLLVMATALGCGGTQATDRPEDCRADEYFDEGREQCRTCPAVVVPSCLPGCGFDVTEDTRECPVLRCDETCEGCDEGEVWDREEEICVSE